MHVISDVQTGLINFMSVVALSSHCVVKNLTSPSSNPNSPDVNFGHEQCEVSQVGELNVGIKVQ